MSPTFAALGGRQATRPTTRPRTLTRFRFEVDGVEIGVFGALTGVQPDVGIDAICAADHRSPRRPNWPHLVLRRGVTETDAVFAWLSTSCGNALAGDDVPARRTGSVTAVDANGIPLGAWEIADVFPIRWKRPGFQVGDHRSADEELELAHHGVRPTMHRSH